MFLLFALEAWVGRNVFIICFGSLGWLVARNLHMNNQFAHSLDDSSHNFVQKILKIWLLDSGICNCNRWLCHFMIAEAMLMMMYVFPSLIGWQKLVEAIQTYILQIGKGDGTLNVLHGELIRNGY